jgi:fatty-acid peroxygenase
MNSDQGDAMQSNEVIKEKTFDTNLGMLTDPYRFISRKLDRYHTNALESSFLFVKKAVILRGEEGAKLFYDKDKFSRVNVMPSHIEKPLFGRGTIHSTDGEQHLSRKKLFIDILQQANLPTFIQLYENKWYQWMRQWEQRDAVVLLDEVSEVLCSSISEWCGLKVPDENIKQFTKECREMVESAGQFGPPHWFGRYQRLKSQHWIADYIEKIRSGEIQLKPDCAVWQIAHYEEMGKPLSKRQAAVTLLNIIRPCVAAARFVVFGALALHEHPEHGERLALSDFREWYAHEIRRFYPFVPGLMARAREDFSWKNYQFKKGSYALLDIYGTNRDPAIWERPEEFDPERFKHWDQSPYNFVPQGGGDVELNHRCPGEWMTIEIIKKSMWLLSQSMQYQVPAQDLRIEFNKLITQPRSGFIISVKRH